MSYLVSFVCYIFDIGKIYPVKGGQRKPPENKGLIVIRYYLALRGAENGVTAMVTPFFCVQG